MALTATATEQTRKDICKLLGMLKPSMIVKSPDKPNIVYCVSEKMFDVDETFIPILEELRLKRSSMDKTIIFCRSYDQCCEVFLFFKHQLGKEIIDPLISPDLARFRLIDMFTACTTKTVKESIINSFSDINGKLRIVVATIAF